MYKLNRRAIVRIWDDTRDQYAGGTATLISQYTKWAQVDNRRGGINNSQGKDQWEYDTVFIMRHEQTRPTKSNYTIDYEGCRYIINQVVIENEAHNKWDKCYCSMVDENITASGDPLPVSNAFMEREDFTLPSDQQSVTVTGVNAIPAAQVMAIVLDGYDYPNIITSGIPINDQVKYNPVGSIITFPYEVEGARNGYVLYQIPVPA